MRAWSITSTAYRSAPCGGRHGVVLRWAALWPPGQLAPGLALSALFRLLRSRRETMYTHVADQHSVFHTQVIACSVREATYVLDGRLDNDTILRPKEHFVDQHGYTDQLFGLCHLLGYSLMPRLTVRRCSRGSRRSRSARAESAGSPNDFRTIKRSILSASLAKSAEDTIGLREKTKSCSGRRVAHLSLLSQEMALEPSESSNRA